MTSKCQKDVERDYYLTRRSKGWVCPVEGRYHRGRWYWRRDMSSHISSLPCDLFNALPGAEDPTFPGTKEYDSPAAAWDALIGVEAVLFPAASRLPVPCRTLSVG
jgi:hypothetical protein